MYKIATLPAVCGTVPGPWSCLLVVVVVPWAFFPVEPKRGWLPSFNPSISIHGSPSTIPFPFPIHEVVEEEAWTMGPPYGYLWIHPSMGIFEGFFRPCSVESARRLSSVFNLDLCVVLSIQVFLPLKVNGSAPPCEP